MLLVALPIGLLAGQSVDRSVSLGFYLLGSFLTIAGFFVGNRGPLRSGGAVGEPRVGRQLRRASREEQFETMAVSAVFILLGIALIVCGIVVDSRYAVA